MIIFDLAQKYGRYSHYPIRAGPDVFHSMTLAIRFYAKLSSVSIDNLIDMISTKPCISSIAY